MLELKLKKVFNNLSLFTLLFMSASTFAYVNCCNFTPLRTNGICSSILLLLSFIFTYTALKWGGGGGKAPPSPSLCAVSHVEQLFLAFLEQSFYSRLLITRTLANSNLALTRTKIDFPWISVIHLL